MNVLALLIVPMWAFSSIWIYMLATTEARSVSSRTVSDLSLPARKESMHQISSKMEDRSPGVPEVKIAQHHVFNKKILAALVVSSSLLGGILLCLFCFWVCRLKNSNSISEGQQRRDPAKGVSLRPILGGFNPQKIAGQEGTVAFIDYQLLVAATHDFQDNNILGGGGFGCMYKAQFNGDSFAVVKWLHGKIQGAHREFQNEVDWLSRIHHQNIVSLLGYCTHGETRLLVYEMMHNYSLEFQLHGPSRGSALTWYLRLRIALDVARGLEFLHECCNPPVIHRGLKSTNILLDSNFIAKISDFGLARASGRSQSKDSIEVSGTSEYIAPEYHLGGNLTDKSDVYAFGIVLLELLTGRKPAEKASPAQCHSIVTWTMPQLTDRSKLPGMVDPVIRNTMDLKHLFQVAAVALLCVQPEPSYRPLITDVLHSLIPLVPLELGGSLKVPEKVSD
ncbi:Non-specific serine/threonine protein kinase [Bertholletia excelsa]